MMPDIEAKLAAYCGDPRTAIYARLTACETLWARGISPGEAERLAAAEAYAFDLIAGHPTGWGLPTRTTQRMDHLVALGPPALRALRPLLHCDNELLYDGSEVATIAGGMDYRVHDLAGVAVARILGETYPAGEQSRVTRARAAYLLDLRIEAKAL